MSLLEVGRIVRAHGLSGEVIIDLVTNRSERLAPGSVLHCRDGIVEVESSSPHQGRYRVRLRGVTTREAAEELRGALLSAEAIDDPEALWVHELIGASLLDTAGVDHGRVVEVLANPASDLLVLEGGGLVPLTFVVERRPGEIVAELPAGLLD